MYKYMCVVCENADKNAFYDVISEIKSLYRNCTEIPYAGSDTSEMGQILNIPDKYGEKTKIYIKYEYDKRRVVALSEDYLSGYYEGKKVDEVFFYSGKKFGKGKEMGLSIAFLIVNIIAAFIGFCIGRLEFDFTVALIALILSAVYIFSSLLIKIKLDISLPKIFFIQSGGYLALITLPVAFVLAYISNSWGGVFVILFEMIYLRIVLIALVVSGITTSIILFIIKKVNHSEKVLTKK